MTKDMTCIICPRGCALKVKIEGENITVSGNSCPKGKQYAIDECTNPTRTVTSSVRVENREDTMVSIKTEKPVPKDKIFEVMRLIRAKSVCAPVKIGDVIIKDAFGTNIVATKDIA
mgnify:FL=1